MPYADYEVQLAKNLARQKTPKQDTAARGASSSTAGLEREYEFRRWWAKNHPFDWWAKERGGEPLGHGDRLRVWSLCRETWMSSNKNYAPEEKS